MFNKTKKNNLICVLSLIFVVILLSGCASKRDKESVENDSTSEASNAPESSKEAVIPENSTEPEYLCLVKSGMFKGSGAVVNIDGVIYVVTSAHVVNQSVTEKPDVEITLCGGNKLEAESVYVASDCDLALLTVSEATIAELKLKDKAVLAERESFDKLADLDRVYLKGYIDDKYAAGEGDVSYTWVYLEDFSQYMMIVDGGCAAGMSGGPVVNADGKLVGIICGVSEYEESAVLPLPFILTFAMSLK